jgi:phosphopyruvate hydratase
MSDIAATHAHQILDSRGHPTVEVEVTLRSGIVGRAAVPAGRSTGRPEAVALRDGGEKWSAVGVSAAVDAVKGEIGAALRGRDPHDQAALDRTLLALDGTREKSRLGANHMLATSLAAGLAAASEAGVPLWRHLGGAGAVQLPVPLLDVLNGGVRAANRLDFEEFMIVPAGAPSFSEALRIGTEVFHELRYSCLLAGAAPHSAATAAMPPIWSQTRAHSRHSLRRSPAPATNPDGTFGSESTQRRVSFAWTGATRWRMRDASCRLKISPPTTTSSRIAIRS